MHKPGKPPARSVFDRGLTIERETSEGKLTWHSLRHTFGTRLGAANEPPNTVRVLMGHADLKTTQRYLTSDANQMREAVERLTGSR